MTTWTQIYGSDQPVRGSEASFDAAADAWAATHSDARALDDEFTRIIFDSSQIACQGLSIERLKTIMRNYQNPISQLCMVSNQTRWILHGHAAKLRELKLEASRALARASVQWDLKRSASTNLGSHSARRTTLKRQLEQLPLISLDPATQADRTRLAGELQAANGQYAEVQKTVAKCEVALDAERAAWQVIRSKEDDLNHATIEALKHIELGALGDPSLFEQARDKVKDYAKAVADYVKAHWKEWLSALYELLSQFLDILGWVMIGITALAALLAMTGIGGPIAGILLLVVAGLAAISLLLSVVKLSMSIVLVGAGAVNSKGEPYNMGDIIGSAIGVGLSLLPGGKLAKPVLRSVVKAGMIDSRTKLITRLIKPIGNDVLTRGGQYVRNELIEQGRDKVIDKAVSELFDKPEATKRMLKNLAERPTLLTGPRPYIFPFPQPSVSGSW